MSDASMTPERAAEYDALFSRFVEALRADTGLVIELAEVSAKAAAARDRLAEVAAKAAAARDELADQGTPPLRLDPVPEVVKPPRPENLKTPRVKLTGDERRERQRESQRRYNAMRVKPAVKPKRPALTAEEKREKARVRYAALTPEQKRERAAYARRYYLAHKVT